MVQFGGDLVFFSFFCDFGFVFFWDLVLFWFWNLEAKKKQHEKTVCWEELTLNDLDFELLSKLPQLQSLRLGRRFNQRLPSHGAELRVILENF